MKKLNEAVKEVREEYPSTESHKCDWLFFVKVMEKMGFPVFIKFHKDMPSPDSIMREWRRQMGREETKRAKMGIIIKPFPKSRIDNMPNSWMS